MEDGKEPRLLLMMPVRHGKLLADSTPMLTTRGWKTHGTLAVGDEVFSTSGAPVRVVAVADKALQADIRVTFTDGSCLLCHDDHEWTVYHRPRAKWITVETRHWLEPNRYGVRRNLKSGPRYTYQLPAVEPVEFPYCGHTIEPYVLGAWLGDGSAGKPCITGAASDPEIIEAVVALGYKISTVCEHSTTKCLTTYFSGDNTFDAGLVPRRVGKIPGRMSQELMALGIFSDKRIPADYLRMPVAMRLELLAGLIDTDGGVDKGGRVTFTTVSDTLRDDVMELVRSLGQSVGCYTAKPCLSSSGIQGRRPTHCISFTPTIAIPTRLPRKKIIGNKREARSIVSVERVPHADAELGRCIQVAAPDGLYLAGTHLIPTHNSEIASRHFAPWVLGKHPDWEIIAASGAQSLAMSFSRYIRDLVRDPAYQSVFEHMRLDPSSQSVENWNTTYGGGYLAAGIGTMITGRGAHVLVIDDPVKDAEAADSQIIRDSVWEWYMSTALTRLAPGGGVLGIMTWWSEDDWAGRIQQVMATGDGDKFEIVKYPAINDQGNEFILPDNSIEQIPLGAPVPEGATLTRTINSALHPARYTLEMLQKRRANYYALGQQRWWAALYQQNPTPEDGSFFTKAMFIEYVHAPQRHGRRIYQAWDFAITEKQKSDYTVGITGLVDEYDNMYILDVWRFKTDDGIELGTAIMQYSRTWSSDLLAVEDGQIWKSIKSNFDKACEVAKHYPSYEVIVPLTDKRTRAQPARGRMQQGKIQFPSRAPWYPEFKAELLRFQAGGRHDDQTDALSHLVRLATAQAAPKGPPQPKMPDSWKTKLARQLRGAGGSHMAA